MSEVVINVNFYLYFIKMEVMDFDFLLFQISSFNIYKSFKVILDPLKFCSVYTCVCVCVCLYPTLSTSWSVVFFYLGLKLEKTVSVTVTKHILSTS